MIDLFSRWRKAASLPDPSLAVFCRPRRSTLLTLMILAAGVPALIPTGSVAEPLPPASDSTPMPADTPEWWKTMPARIPDGDLRTALIKTLRAEMSPPRRKLLYDCIEQALVTTESGTPSNLVAVIVPPYMRDLLDRRDIMQASQFLRNQEALLTDLLPFDTALWKMQVAVLAGNGEDANNALAAAVSARPAYSNSADYAKQVGIIFKLNTTTVSPLSLEQTPQSVPESLEAMMRNSETNRLCLTIRTTLRSCGDNAVAAPGEASLFAGAKPYYRRELASYAALYEPWLAQEIANLNQQSTRREDAARLDRTAHLTSPPRMTTTRPPRPPPLAGSVPDGFTALVDMAPGTLEVAESHLCHLVTHTTRLDPPATLSTDEHYTWLSNSRMVTRLAGGRVVWTWCTPLQRIIQTNDERPHTTGCGTTLPAVAGPVVAISTLLRSATLGIVGLDRDTGGYLWRWNSRAASDPVAWGTNRLAVLQADWHTRSKVNLVILDATTGKACWTMPLSSSRTPGGAMKAGSVTFIQDLSWKIPAPLIEDDVAYISTSMGMVMAVNLADESILWMRNYTRYEDATLLGLRSVRPPVSGRNTILFSPWDSKSLLLVDKSTGKLITSRTHLAWQDVIPCGPDHALLLDESTAHILSLTDLTEVKTFPNPDYRVVQPVREGCLVSKRDASVSLIRPDGSIAEVSRSASDEQLIGCGPDGFWYAAGGPGRQWCGVKQPPASPPPALIRRQQKVAPHSDFSESQLVATNALFSLALSGQILVALTDTSDASWELPTPGNACGILSIPGRVLCAHSGRLWIHDEKTGALLQTFPPNDTSPLTILAVLPSTEGWGYAIGRDTNPQLGVWNLDASGLPTGSPLARLDPRLASLQFEQFSLITGPTTLSLLTANDPWLNRSAIWTAPRNPEPAILRESQAPFSSSIWISGDRTRGAVLSPSGNLYTVDAAGVRSTPTPLNAWTKTGKTLQGPSSAGDFITLRKNPTNLAYLNPATGKLLETKPSGLGLTDAIGTKIYGLTASSPFQPALCTVNSSTTLTKGPVLPDWIKASDPREPDWMSKVISQGHATVLLLTPPPYSRQRNRVKAENRNLPPSRDDGIALVWSGDQFTSAHRLPNLPHPPLAWTSPQGLVNINGTWMSAPQWQTALLLRDTPRICRATPEVVIDIDGFLDDWPETDFFATPYGRMAMRVTGPGEVSLAVSLTETGLVERLGTSGLNHQLDLSVLPENEIGFGDPPSLFPKLDFQQGKTTSYYTRTMRFAWTVRPDGKACQIEVVVTGLPVNPNGANPDSIGARLLWYTSPAEKPVNLIGTASTGPLSYVYARFR